MSRQRQTMTKRRPMRGLGLGILLAFALGLVLLQTAPSIREAFNPVRTAASDQLVGNGRTGWLARVTGEAARNARIAELETEVRELSRWRAAAITMAERLETYEDMLNVLGEPPAQGFTARVIAESDGPFSETLLANAGRQQGLEIGFVAVNEGGLVGRVIQLGERSSRILRVTDFNSRVPVMGEVSGVRAILYGGRDGLGVLTDLPERDQFVPGERVLTSGEGGVFPRGIVTGIAQKRGDAWRVPYAHQEGTVGFVRLVPPVRIPTPEEEPVVADPSAIADDAAQTVETASATRVVGQ